MKADSFATLALGLLLATASVPALAQSVAPATAPQLLIDRLNQMSAEIDKLKAEVQQLRAQQGQTEATAQRASQDAQQARTELATVAGTGLKPESATVINGYGEIVYSRPLRRSGEAQADLRRAVIGLQHRLNDKTKLVTEIEFEHAITSADDQGEVAIEQAYIEHQLKPGLAVRAGLFLVPLGLVNESHEPHTFYGVDRPLVETAIIPSTYREGGVMLVGDTDNGLNWKLGLSTYFDLSKWDSTSAEGKASPLASVHQELQLARAKNLAVLGSLDWRGRPGLLVGAGFISGKAGQGATTGANPRITLADLHARWTPGKWDLQSVYARGTVSGAGPLNVAFAAGPTPIPSRFDGLYLQAAYKLWSNGDKALKPFVRLERFNTAAAYSAFSAGLGRAADPYTRVAVIGANYHLAPTVVVKADLQRFVSNRANDRFNLSLGYAF